jgi:pyruvate formate lyase activating enzyme
MEPQLQLFPEKCIGCGSCYKICPSARKSCGGCGKCAEVCYAEALILRGKSMTVGEVMAEVEKDRAFYEKSGGGVTFSGGEPLLQADFLCALLRESKLQGINTAVDTAGNAAWEIFESIMPYADLWLYDFKILDNAKHKEATGVYNDRILENLRTLIDAGANVHVRIPVIPSVNDGEAEMKSMAEFLEKLGHAGSVEYLPFHQMAGGKYESLGMTYQAADLPDIKSSRPD